MSFRKTGYPEDFRPEMELTPEERAARVRRFRRKAVLTDICLVLTVVCAVLAVRLMLAPLLYAVPVLLAGAMFGLMATYGGCPLCGRKPRKWDWAWTPLLWRFYRCPDCGFTPRRDRKRREGNEG